MLDKIVAYSIKNKLIILLFVFGLIGFGVFALINIPIGAVPDITNNQVQVITTSRNLSTQDVEQFITYPIELEMANLPNVKEIRSVSKFGLSVVTIVFDDKIGTFIPRQLIAEKIKIAEEKIPSGFGKPFMGPITTGLGEIYQYVLDVKPKYKDQYSIMELRTIQDWIVKRQLSGIPGVVEVNTWGGFLKQYEVAINPNQLKGLNININEVFKALEKNNNIAGGSYIEKSNESYFVRGKGLASSIQDIEKIIVANRNDVPIRIKDLAKVKFGYATRFGAITANGEGEKVLGQVMMLKGADSKSVIENVKKRINKIKHSLPEGVYINPILERSELINKTTFTISENLILGCLIVIFVVVLLLGNIRSGLVVASVIPICLLFAIAMMYLFGIDANLMSLGAIDFGIIIDGAVIIVEFIAFKITSQSALLIGLERTARQQKIDEIAYTSTSKMMHSAVFGQIIIIIVFIPILSLSGVEGKMFIPMALTFCFALIGAMILCFTYVPVVSSLIIKPRSTNKINFSSKIIGFLTQKYTKILTWSLRQKKIVLSAATILLLSTVILFNKMGGEFVPTLDEGDFVIQPVLKTGTSLAKTIQTTTEIEKILKTFPEVDQTVSRIGAAEVPTDPMSMEESDVIIKLKPKSEWTSASSKDELAKKFKEKLSILPNVEYEFTQPIEMRFNELITGVRADIAIKVFGDDLNILYQKATEIKEAIKNIEGAADITVEKIVGLPQMSVVYNREKIAQYGLNIEDINKILTISFAGLPAGYIFEGEKQFDLVLRYDSAHRADIQDISNTFVPLNNGATIPLRELATISYVKGPAKISRDETKRRVVVGINVRERDLESVVEDIQGIIAQKLELPTGYTIQYSGQFDNLRSAKQRLLIAVPIALILIFILLYFAFHNIKDALMVYSAIPLSAVGGIFLLYIRNMPFSISAGVGFIALFGIAVLNGLVLIEHFKELKKTGMKNLTKIVIVGTRDRLRPVLLTASAAALGFLPMAISTSAGAEVQRPLATVVLGGLVTATILTLVVLPLLYIIFNKKSKAPANNKSKKNLYAFLLILPLFAFTKMKAQDTLDNVNQAFELALQNNKLLKAQNYVIEQNERQATFNIDKTNIYYGVDQNNITPEGNLLQTIGVQQNFSFPSTFISQNKLNKTGIKLSQTEKQLYEQTLKEKIALTFDAIIFWQNMRKHYILLDSTYTQLSKAAKLSLEVGETSNLALLATNAKTQSLKVMIAQSTKNIEVHTHLLNSFIQADTFYTVASQNYIQQNIQATDIENHPNMLYYDNLFQQNQAKINYTKNKALPDIQLEYFQGLTPNEKSYHGFQVGLGVPIFYQNQKSNIVKSKLQNTIITLERKNTYSLLQSKLKKLQLELEKYAIQIDYYNNEGEKLVNELRKTAQISWEEGEIDIYQFILLAENINNIEIEYLENLKKYNETAISINYLNSEK